MTHDDDQEMHSPEGTQHLQELKHRMRTFGSTREDPVREVLSLVGDRWTTLILEVLQSDSYRYATLRRILSELDAESEISERILTLKLRSLERNGIVLRTLTPTNPPRVDYRLTPLGQALRRHVETLLRWAEDNTPQMHQARAIFDERSNHKDHGVE